MVFIQSIILAVIGYFILLLVVANLVGLVVRGFFTNPEMAKLKETTHPLIKAEIKKTEGANFVVTIFFAIIFLIFLFLLYKFLNIWAVVATLLIVVVRVPDLLWELKHGTKAPTSGFYLLSMLLSWLALPILWWSFYTWLS